MSSRVDFAITKIFGCLIDRAVQPNDNVLQVKRKRIIIPLCVVLMLMSLTVIIVRSDVLLLFAVGCVMMCASVPPLICTVMMQMEVNELMVNCITGMGTLSIMLIDISSTALPGHERFWSTFVIVVDVLLVVESKGYTTLVVLFASVAYLFVMSVETTWRFGLLDFEFSGHEQEIRREHVTCSKLPCATDAQTSSLNFTLQLFIFVTDFVCTRGFAFGLIEERNRVIASISTADSIATSLSRYDLDQARKLLEGNEHSIPAGLRSAFESLLSSLATYQPYLPPSCLHHSIDQRSSDEEVEEIPPTPLSPVSVSGSFLVTSVSSRSVQLPGPSTPLQGLDNSLRCKSFGLANSLRRSFQYVKASFLVVNIRNSMSALSVSLAAYERLINVSVSTTVEAIVKFRGMPDLFLGDRMFASFGASRKNLNHSKSCFETASEIIDTDYSTSLSDLGITDKKFILNAGLATGQVACGDWGNADLLRFSFIGKPSMLVSVIERIGVTLSIPIIAEYSFHKTIRHVAESRIILQQLLYADSLEFLFEVVAEKHLQAEQGGEWMYAMQKKGVGKWDRYNTLAAEFLSSGKSSSALDNFLKTNEGGEHDALRSITENGLPPLIIIPKR